MTQPLWFAIKGKDNLFLDNIFGWYIAAHDQVCELENNQIFRFMGFVERESVYQLPTSFMALHTHSICVLQALLRKLPGVSSQTAVSAGDSKTWTGLSLSWENSFPHTRLTRSSARMKSCVLLSSTSTSWSLCSTTRHRTRAGTQLRMRPRKKAPQLGRTVTNWTLFSSATPLLRPALPRHPQLIPPWQQPTETETQLTQSSLWLTPQRRPVVTVTRTARRALGLRPLWWPMAFWERSRARWVWWQPQVTSGDMKTQHTEVCR